MNREVKSMVPNYVKLNSYYGSNVAYNVDLVEKVPMGVQIVPDFGVSYKTPNYNSLVGGSCTTHKDADRAYKWQNCVTYHARMDGPNGSYYADQMKGHTGANH